MLTDLLERVPSRALESRDKFNLSFDKLNNEVDYTFLLGISKVNFDDLVSHVIPMRNTKTKTIRNAICILLFKLKSGLSNGLVTTLWVSK